jgi:hypothetical protein
MIIVIVVVVVILYSGSTSMIIPSRISIVISFSSSEIPT